MKHLMLIIVTLLSIFYLQAGISTYYAFVPSTGTYISIEGTDVAGTMGDDLISAPVNLGFSFPYGFDEYSQVKLCSNGFITLGSDPENTSVNSLTSTAYCPVLAPLWDDTYLSAPAQYLLTGEAPSRIFTIQYTNVKWSHTANNSFSYQVKLFETGNIEFVYGPATGGPSEASASIGINMQPGGISNFLSITPGPPATCWDSVENTQVSDWPGQGTIYSFNAIEIIEFDIAAVSLSGNEAPSVGTEYDYEISLTNSGLISVEAGTYTLKLMNGETELTSGIGPNLLPGQTVPATLAWEPSAAGLINLSAKVEFPADQVPGNNQTGALIVYVQPPGAVIVTIGDNSELARVPVDMHWKNSLFETMFYQDEIALGGVINGISLKNDFASNLADKPLNIWLGTTNLPNLSAGWIPSGLLTPVFSGNISFPSGVNSIFIPLTSPYTYCGGNLVMLVERPMDIQQYDALDRFFCQTVGTLRSRNIYSNDTDYDPANPPSNGSTLSGIFPRTSLYLLAGVQNTLNGTVTSSGNPLAGVSVAVNNMSLVQTTAATGGYSFLYLPPGTYNLTVSKIGYFTQVLPVVIVAGQSTVLDINMVAMPLVNVTGMVVGSDAPTIGLSGASVYLIGVINYQVDTDAQGQFIFNSVLTSNSYTYTVFRDDYQPISGTIAVETADYNMNTVIMNENAPPSIGVAAVQNLTQTAVDISWFAPGADTGDWMQWDSGEHVNNIGSNAISYFEIASRWPAADLVDYAGQSMYAIRFYPHEANCTYRIRVWIGGDATGPGVMVADQAVSNPTINAFNTVLLSTPISIPQGEELWFGVNLIANTGYPVGCDAGPAYDGFGNMIHWQADWITLTSLSPTLNYNWNLAAYVGYCAPTASSETVMQPNLSEYVNTAVLFNDGSTKALGTDSSFSDEKSDRSLEGYRVWRLPAGQENNVADWNLITSAVITDFAYTDIGWVDVSSGIYRWAVKAVYSNNVESAPIFSNTVQRNTQIGTLTGTVCTDSSIPVSEVLVRAGNYTTSTNPGGVYSLVVPSGTYTVTATKIGYAVEVQTGVIIQTNQTTTVNFNLSASPLVLDGFEDYSDFSLSFPPWVNIDDDHSVTYNPNGYNWLNRNAPQAFIVFNPGSTAPPSTNLIGTPHSGNKMVVCWGDQFGPNDDWLISQVFSVGSGASFSFYARSMSSNFGHEAFRVGFSSGGTNPDSFTTLSGVNAIMAPYTWTLYTFELPESAYGDVRVGIHCVSQDVICFQVDDFEMNLGAMENIDNQTFAASTTLRPCFPNPFISCTTIHYAVKKTTPVTIDIYNTKGQKVKTLINETKSGGRHSISWNGLDENGNPVSGGIYFYKMTAGKFSSTRKMILLK